MIGFISGVCNPLCLIGRTLKTQSVLKADGQLVEDHGPVHHRFGPLLGNVLSGQEEQLTSGFGIGETTFGLDNLAQLAVIAFDCVGGVDQPADLGGVIKEGRQVGPVVLPGAHGQSVLASPGAHPV